MTFSANEQQRPDPDQLLQMVQQEEAKAHRGRLKIFFGSSAGVGKTCAMLVAGKLAQEQGIEVIVGLVETHGRSHTSELAQTLPQMPLKSIDYKGRVLQEFDLDGALSFGKQHPNGLILLDELAHSNVQGSRHAKRWQDVQELLEAGIDVWTTVNVQHLESLNDVVSGITGIRVWETVPDTVFDDADEVVMVDLPPEELLTRLKEGKVYLPHQAERAAANFFRKGNLLALRELALRRTADRVDDEVQAYRKESSVKSVWATRESMLACIGLGENSEKIVRSCARLASQLDVQWHAVYVESPDHASLSSIERQHPLRALRLAKELGATTASRASNEVATALVQYAREHNLSRLVVGRTGVRRWYHRRSLADDLARLASDVDVLQISLPHEESSKTTPTPEREGSWNWQGYATAVGVCVLTAVLSTPLLDVFELTNIVMIFLMAVIGVAYKFGRGPAVVASFLAVGLFDFFFVPPRYSFAVSDAEYLVTFVVMLSVGLLVGQLTAGLKVQAQAATMREHRVRSLYEMSRDLSAVLVPEQVAEIGARFLKAEFSAKFALLVADDDNQLQLMPNAQASIDLGVAEWAYRKGENAGKGTNTLAASPSLFIPLKAPMRTRGVMAIEPPSHIYLGPEQIQLLDTCASLLAISLERIHYISVAQVSSVQIESERLRNSLLSAISHDIRTPLASMIGLIDTLRMGQAQLSAEQQNIVQSIKKSALRMSALVHNLLDMARLEAGGVQLHLEWQPIEECIGSALASAQLFLQDHPVQTMLPPNLPLLKIDAVLIERVFVNLLENASKYTPASTPIRISASLHGQHQIVRVEDFGPGIPAGMEHAIFEKFERGHKEHPVPGVGLGLTICRAIMLAHGGQIRAFANAQGGACFELSFPLGNPPDEDGSQLITG